MSTNENSEEALNKETADTEATTSQEKETQKKSPLDILLEEIDEERIKMGLKPAVWGTQKGCGVYIKQQLNLSTETNEEENKEKEK